MMGPPFRASWVRIPALIVVPWCWLHLAVATTSASSDERIEPWVSSFHGVLSKRGCKKIIDKAEDIGFSMNYDSIDDEEEGNASSQQIEVLDLQNGGIVEESLWDLISPLMPRLTDLVQSHKEEIWDLDRAREKRPLCGWIFLRKYAPSSQRNMLKLHHDSNMFTVNLFLNDDYEGGGLFYVRPPREAPGSYLEEYEFRESGNQPYIPNEWMEYDWLSSIKRRNTTTTHFPGLPVGDALIHNYTVWHAVAPLEKGVKYSLLFFFDMDNPDLQDDDAQDHELEVTFVNRVAEGTVDLFWLEDGDSGDNDHNDDDTEILEIESDMDVDVEYGVATHEGHRFQAARREDGRLLGYFEIVKVETTDKIIYEIHDSSAEPSKNSNSASSSGDVGRDSLDEL